MFPRIVNELQHWNVNPANMCSVSTVFTNLASLTCEVICASDAAKDLVELKQRHARHRKEKMTKRNIAFQIESSAQRNAEKVKQCAVVLPRKKSSSECSDVSCAEVKSSSNGSFGVCSSDSDQLKQRRTKRVRKRFSVLPCSGLDGNLSIAPDAYYDSCRESSSVLIVEDKLPRSVKSRRWNTTKRTIKRKAGLRTMTTKMCRNFRETRRGNNIVAKCRGSSDVVENDKLVNASFLTCESKENVDHCTCQKNSEARIRMVSYNLRDTDLHQSANGNQSNLEVRMVAFVVRCS